ncbi:hypothetical protein ACFPIJ_09130 [Dactylosporangium cerinum]|uniref:Integral membrane protein n=1 Tax=Dactylosporangium cerinum TaxID=1434730 RepID=A0ABV9VNQ2_9ACTN
MTDHLLTTPGISSPTLRHRVRLAAVAGLAGAALTFVSWALLLSDAAPGTTQWTVASIIGTLAIAGQTIMITGMIAARETGDGHTGRGFLTLWAVAQTVLVAGGVVAAVTGSTDTVLLPIGAISAALAALVASVFIAANRRLHGLRRWAPLAYTLGGVATGFFQGDRHTLQVNLADLANALLALLLAVGFLTGQRTDH